jgi:hypothetical protein
MERVKSKLEEMVREWWKPVTIIILAATLLFFNAASNSATQARLEEVATETHAALCTFKADLQRRADDTRAYLQKHPGVEPIPGITRADLRRSLNAQRDTLESLVVLDCS